MAQTGRREYFARCLQFRCGGCRCLTSRWRKQPPPGETRVRPDFVPSQAQHVGHAFGLRLGRDLDPVQIALRTQEGKRIGDTINGDINSAILFKLRRVAGNFQAHRGGLVGTKAGFREQEKLLARNRTVVRAGRSHFVGPGGAGDEQERQDQRDKNARRKKPAKLGLSSRGRHRVSFHCSSWAGVTARRPLS